MNRLIIIAAIGVTLAGCQSVEMASTPRTITFSNVGTYTIKETTDNAQKHCQKFGRDAELVPDSNPDGIATYKCVDR